jgi:hypothetical protein
MTGIEVTFIVLFLAALAALVGLGVAFYLSRWSSRKKLDRCSAAVDAGLHDLERERGKREAESAKAKAAQDAAAKAFVASKAAEAKLAALGAQPLRLGLTYMTRNSGVAGVMTSLQKIMGGAQKSQCSASYSAFMVQKREIIDNLKKQVGNTKCTDISKALVAPSESLRVSLIDALPPGTDVLSVVAEVQVMWKLVSVEVCNKAGVLDYGMLDAFMTALFGAVCG